MVSIVMSCFQEVFMGFKEVELTRVMSMDKFSSIACNAIGNNSVNTHQKFKEQTNIETTSCT